MRSMKRQRKLEDIEITTFKLFKSHYLVQYVREQFFSSLQTFKPQRLTWLQINSDICNVKMHFMKEHNATEHHEIMKDDLGG